MLYPKVWTAGSPTAKVALLGLHADSCWVPKTLASSHCSQILGTASQMQTKASTLRVSCNKELRKVTFLPLQGTGAQQPLHRAEDSLYILLQ